jgi:hypothetical protein
MPAPLHKPVALLLTATLAIIAGVGEGLHWIPGSGHAVVEGNRMLLLGYGLPQRAADDDGRAEVNRPEGPSLPICDEDQCAVCSLLAKQASDDVTSTPPLVVPMLGLVYPAVLCRGWAAAVLAYQSRAPPVG